MTAAKRSDSDKDELIASPSSSINCCSSFSMVGLPSCPHLQGQSECREHRHRKRNELGLLPYVRQALTVRHVVSPAFQWRQFVTALAARRLLRSFLRPRSWLRPTRETRSRWRIPSACPRGPVEWPLQNCASSREWRSAHETACRSRRAKPRSLARHAAPAPWQALW